MFLACLLKHFLERSVDTENAFKLNLAESIISFNKGYSYSMYNIFISFYFTKTERQDMAQRSLTNQMNF